MSDSLLTYLLRCIESFPETKFYESDLTRSSAPEFAQLKKQRYLVFDQYDFEKESYFDKRGNERFVSKVNGKWVATATDDPELSPIYLAEKDLNRYSFGVQPLLAEIKVKNALARNIDQITPRVYFVGEKTVLQDSISVFVAFLGDDEQAEAELLGLRAKTGKADKILVLCPAYVITSQDLLARLAGQNIVCLTFKEALNGKGYAIDFGKVRFENASGQTRPKLTSTQIADYETHKYLCYDRLHILGTPPVNRSSEILIDGKKIKIPDAPFRLLIELVTELKKGAGGWVTKHTEVGKYQSFERLREPFDGHVNSREFIENDGSKRYRISIHPDFVTYERGNLLKHSDTTVQELTKRLPKEKK